MFKIGVRKNCGKRNCCQSIRTELIEFGSFLLIFLLLLALGHGVSAETPRQKLVVDTSNLSAGQRAVWNQVRFYGRITSSREVVKMLLPEVPEQDVPDRHTTWFVGFISYDSGIVAEKLDFNVVVRCRGDSAFPYRITLNPDLSGIATPVCFAVASKFTDVVDPPIYTDRKLEYFQTEPEVTIVISSTAK